MHKTEKGWRVREHLTTLLLNDVKFIVRESGRQLVIKEKRKNVHAFIEGEKEDDNQSYPSLNGWVRITYNPYTDRGFHMGNNDVILKKSSSCVLTPNGVYIK